MVELVRRIIKGKKYYYLEHSVREGPKVWKKDKYLGKEKPKDIGSLKKEFMLEILREKWRASLKNIKKNYLVERKNTPKSAQIKNYENFAIRFTYDTQRIEGSTLTLRETANLLEEGITPRIKPIRDVKEAEAHNRLFHKILRFKEDINLRTVLKWHKELFSETKKDIAGRFRKHNVAIAGSNFVPPPSYLVESLLKDFMKWYKKAKINPVELAALVHLKFVTIHPFSDGNGRISRLLMNFVLHRNRYPMLNILYSNRTGYYNALERSQMKKDETIFLQWFMRRYFKEVQRFFDS